MDGRHTGYWPKHDWFRLFPLSIEMGAVGPQIADHCISSETWFLKGNRIFPLSRSRNSSVDTHSDQKKTGRNSAWCLKTLCKPASHVFRFSALSRKWKWRKRNIRFVFLPAKFYGAKENSWSKYFPSAVITNKNMRQVFKNKCEYSGFSFQNHFMT